MKTEFSGTFGPEVEQDIRPLYVAEVPWQQWLFYILFVAVTVYVGFYCLHVELFDSIRFHETRPVHTAQSLSARLTMVGLPLVTFYIAFLRRPHWWMLWWKRTKYADVSGAVDEAGIHVKAVDGGEPTIAWKRFGAARIGGNAVFLPIGRADGIAFHRTFFRDGSHWDGFIELLKSSGIRTRPVNATR